MNKRLSLFIIFIVTSCSYSIYTTSYPYLKTISILSFPNKTIKYGLEEDLLNDISDRFIRDGRLKIVSILPDCQLKGEILDYSNKIYTYGNEVVDEYEVKILFKVIFTDLKKNNIIWQNSSLSLSERYSSSDETSEFKTEEEAQKEIFKDLYETILKNSLEEW